MRLFERSRHRRVAASYARIDGELIRTRVYSAKVRRGVLGFLIGDAIDGIDEVRVMMAASSDLGDDDIIPETLPGQKVIGYEIRMRTGAKSTVTLTGIARRAAPEGAKSATGAETAIELGPL